MSERPKTREAAYTPGELQGGHLTIARQLGVSEARAREILAAIPESPHRYRDAVRLLTGEALDDMAATTLSFAQIQRPAAAHVRQHWVRRSVAAVARVLVKLIGGTRG